MAWRRYGKKRYARHKAEKDKKKPSAVLKVDVSRLPVPPLPATKEVRIGEVVKDSEISSLMEHFSYDPSSKKNSPILPSLTIRRSSFPTRSRSRLTYAFFSRSIPVSR